MAKPAYIVSLTGQGDRAIVLVTKEVFDWIQRTDTPGRVGGESSWNDSAAPAALLAEMAKNEGEVVHVGATIGSFQNDRALYAEQHPESVSFGSSKELNAYLKTHDMEIEDEYEGYIY